MRRAPLRLVVASFLLLLFSIQLLIAAKLPNYRQPLSDDLPGNREEFNYHQSSGSAASCSGLRLPAAHGMVYWNKTPDESPFRQHSDKYMIFEADIGGFNNQRLAFETVAVLALVTGRTLVLPPKQPVPHFRNQNYTYTDFFNLENVSTITMEDFLKQHAGQLKHFMRGNVIFPPGSRTDWDNQDSTVLTKYLRLVTTSPRDWNPNECVLAVANSGYTMQELQTWVSNYDHAYVQSSALLTKIENISILERLEYIWADRKRLCSYDGTLASAKILTLRGRYLVPFYAFVFTTPRTNNQWIARYVRDRVRYADHLQCTAARIVSGLGTNFDGFHVRRGDFWEDFSVNSTQIYRSSRDKLGDGSTIYVATDEYDHDFFHQLSEHYNLVFLGNFQQELGDTDPNYYGLIEQLVLSKAKVFFGCYRSSFTSYITRLRGYHGAKSYYFNEEHKNTLLKHFPIKRPFFSQEWPIAWQDATRV